jgi:hypothetical protein
LQDRTYTPPVIDPSGKSRVDSPADVTDSPDQKRPSVSSDNEKLTEQDLNKDVPDVVAVQEAEFESYGFAHPAASRPQRIVWIPKDTLGLTEEEVRGCEEASVRVSFVDAKLDETGKVGIDGGPPDLV